MSVTLNFSPVWFYVKNNSSGCWWFSCDSGNEYKPIRGRVGQVIPSPAWDLRSLLRSFCYSQRVIRYSYAGHNLHFRLGNGAGVEKWLITICIWKHKFLKKLLKSQIIIRQLLLGSEIVHSNQSIQPLSLSIWAVYLHANKAHWNLTGQHCCDLRQKPQCFFYAFNAKKKHKTW